MSLSERQQIAVKEFNRKIETTQIVLETKSCLCGSDKFKRIRSYDRYGLFHPVVICKECGLIQSNPRLTQEGYLTYYSSDEYRIIHEGADYLGRSRRRFEDGEGEHIFSFISPFFKRANFKSVLEFGCGAGWNLIHFSRRGYEVTGYDYSSMLIELGRSYGLNVKTGSFKQLGETHTKFDIIILNHIIEHFTDFPNSMQSILNHLSPGGIIYVGVPNIDIYEKAQFQNAHVYYFSRRTFDHYMHSIGLEVIIQENIGKRSMHGIYRLCTPVRLENSTLNLEYYRMLCKKSFSNAKVNSRLIVMALLDCLKLRKPLQTLIRHFYARYPQ